MKRALTTIIFVLTFIQAAHTENLKSIKDYFLEGDYKSVILAGEKVLAEENSSQASDELYYLLGLSYLKKGNYLRAWDIFDIVVNEFKGSAFKEEAQAGIADTFFLRGELDKADDYLRRLIRDNPRLKLKAQAFFRLAQIAFKKGDADQAEKFLQKLRQDFPLSFEMRMSKYLSLSLREAGGVYTVQTGYFSDDKNAGRLEQELIQKGYPAYIEEAGGFWRVRTGRLAWHSDALELEQELGQQGYSTKICK